MIIAYIDGHEARSAVELICAVLSEHGVQVTPSTCCERTTRPVTAAELDDAYAVDVLVDLWRADRGLYGLRECWHAPRHPDLVERARATPAAADQWWVADFTSWESQRVRQPVRRAAGR